MVFDFRMKRSAPPPALITASLMIGGTGVEVVSSYKQLGVQIKSWTGPTIWRCYTRRIRVNSISWEGWNSSTSANLLSAPLVHWCLWSPVPFSLVWWGHVIWRQTDQESKQRAELDSVQQVTQGCGSRIFLCLPDQGCSWNWSRLISGSFNYFWPLQFSGHLSNLCASIQLFSAFLTIKPVISTYFPCTMGSSVPSWVCWVKHPKRYCFLDLLHINMKLQFSCICPVLSCI